MAAAALREKQAPLKEHYKSDPSAAIVTLHSSGTLAASGISCSLDTGRAAADARKKVAGLHPKTGGDDPAVSGELCSGDLLLEALVACAGVTLKAVATAMEIPIHAGTVSAEGDLDFRGTMGVDKSAPVGFKEIRLGFDVQVEHGVEVSEAKMQKLGELTERYCVVLQTIVKKPQLTVVVRGNQESEDGVERSFGWSQKS